MTFSRRNFVRTLAALGAAAVMATPAMAQVAGRDFTPVVPAQAGEEPGKIEVLEFFSYGCPHCNDFSPLLHAWAAKLPSDVVLKKVPVTFGRGPWATIAKLYYTLEATGDLRRLDGDVFRAIHVERISLFDDRSVTEWAVSKGVDPKKFSEAFNSFGVNSKVRRGDQLAQVYKITGVPSLAVDGKYLVGGKDFNETLAIADKLIAKARAEKGGKK